MSINLVKDWFYYTRAQRRGIIVLLALLVAIPIISEVIKSRISLQQVDKEAFLVEVRLFEEMLAQAEAEATEANSFSGTASSAGSEQTGRQVVFEPFAFDPNHLSQAEWDSLGMPSHISRSIQNFLAAGGGFRYKEDFKRIYLLQDWMYDELEDYIKLPARPVANAPPARTRQTEKSAGSDHDGTANLASNKRGRSDPASKPSSESNTGASGERIGRNEYNSAGSKGTKSTGKASEVDHKAGFQKTIAASMPVNINTADTTELQSIRGIGPAFSRRIVGYRELLGGFTHTEQLMEVFGLDSTRFEQIRDFVVTDSIVRNKLKLNTADFGELVRHPYIDRQTASTILNLRRQHGQFQDAGDLTKSYLINDNLLDRLLPYVCFEGVEKEIEEVVKGDIEKDREEDAGGKFPD